MATSSTPVNLSNGTQSFDGLLDLIQQQASQWDNLLQGYALSLFWSLALIQIAWLGIQLVLKGADLTEAVAELVRLIMTLGFFLMLLKTPEMTAQKVTYLIVDSFREAGAAAGGSGKEALKPGAIFAAGLEIVHAVATIEPSDNSSILEFLSGEFASVLAALSSLLILLCFAFMAAFSAVTLVESFVVINASILFIGFGGAQWTREYAIAPLRYSIAVGTKLFLLSLIVGLVTESATQWAAAYTPASANSTSIYTLVGLSFIAAYLTKAIPEICASLLNGSSAGGGVTLGGMATAVATGIAAAASAGIGLAAGVAGGAAAGGAAGSATGAAAGGATGAASGAAAGSAASGFGNMARQFGEAMGSALESRVSSTSPGGNFTGRSPSPAASSFQRSPSSPSSSPSSPGSAQASPKVAAAAPASGSGSGSGSRPSPSTDAGSGARAAHSLASAAVRAAGIGMALSTPGAESAHTLTLGAMPDQTGANTGDPETENENWRAQAEMGLDETAPPPSISTRDAISPVETPESDTIQNADPGPSISNPKKD